MTPREGPQIRGVNDFLTCKSTVLVPVPYYPPHAASLYQTTKACMQNTNQTISACGMAILGSSNVIIQDTLDARAFERHSMEIKCT